MIYGIGAPKEEDSATKGENPEEGTAEVVEIIMVNANATNAVSRGT